MVFVSELFLASLIILLIVGIVTTFLTHYPSLTSQNIITQLKLDIIRYRHRNILFILFALYILSFLTWFSTVLAIVFLSWAWHSETLVWISFVHTTLEPTIKLYQRLPLSEFRRSMWESLKSYLKKAVKDFWTNTKRAFAEFKEELRDEYRLYLGTLNFDELFKRSVEESRRRVSEIYMHIKLKPFDYGMFNDPKKVNKEHAGMQFQRDPRVTFNRVRRFPWKLEYQDDHEDELSELLTMSFLVIYNFFKTTLVAVLAMFVYFLYTIFFFKIQFLKQLSVWFVIGMLYFWLMSGFNFFLKRYQYGKFTSQIQRFWKRTNTYFWLIEGFLILLFFYYYLNSSQEPLYMYDYSALNQEFLTSLHVIGVNVILLSVVIYLMYFVMLRLNSNSWTQVNLYLIFISTFVFFSFFIETYQFYYLISTFNERLWVFNEEENMWGVDVDNPILRTKHQYLFVCLIAKYWHFLFIFLSWVFFLMKSFERRKVTYVLFGANLQNMILLYVLNFACYAQWFKWIYRRFFDLPYTWFFTSIDSKTLYRFVFEIKLLTSNLFNLNFIIPQLQNITYKSLELWQVDSIAIWKFL